MGGFYFLLLMIFRDKYESVWHLCCMKRNLRVKFDIKYFISTELPVVRRGDERNQVEQDD